MDFNGRDLSVLFSHEQIARRIRDLGKELERDYEGKNLMVLSILRGSFIFVADLVRSMDTKLCVEFLRTSSYEDAMETSGSVELIYPLEKDVTDFDVLIVDDIIDSGITMKYLLDYIKTMKPKSVKVCSLLDKPSRRRVDIKPDYVGFEVGDQFIVGYGLNYGDYYRNVPYIFCVEH